MRMYFNEDTTKSNTEELDEIIDDLKIKEKEVEERYRKHKATAQKTKEAMQAEIKNLMN